MTILAIDPGTTQSAFLYLVDGRPAAFGIEPNEEVLEIVDSARGNVDAMAIEMVASYGMPVGAEVFETVLWIGRFIQAYGGGEKVYRQEVKLTLCRDSRAKDANIRQAILDRFGGKEVAIGRKATPGPLYGITSHVWSALAVALTYAEKQERKSA